LGNNGVWAVKWELLWVVQWGIVGYGRGLRAVVEYEQVVCIPAVRDARVIVNIRIIVSPSVQGKIRVAISIATQFPCFCIYPTVFFHFRCSGMQSGMFGHMRIFQQGYFRAP
jgi:hypothetical protein